MKFPSKLIPVEKWHAYKAKLPQDSPEEHRIIIIHKHLDNIRYFYVTSKIEKAIILARDDIGSIVKLRVSDWSALTKDSCIQCNRSHLCKISENEFRRLYEDAGMEYFGEVPENVKKLIVTAIRSSKSYSPAEQALYTA